MVLSRRKFLGASAAAAFWLPRVIHAAAGAFVRQPYLQRVLADRASILWTTSQSASGAVVIVAPDGTTTSFPAAVQTFPPSVTQLSSAYYQYQADVTGLQAGTQYRYQVVVGGQTVAADPVMNSFRTPAPGAFSFLVFGDSGADSPQQIALLNQMSAETGISKVIHLGDLAYEDGTFAQFEANYFAINAPLMSRLPFFTTPGNHEYVTDSAAPYLAGHVAPVSGVPAADTGRYYSFDWGDAHFVSVDANLLQTAAQSRMLAWLDADLAASQKYWNIVFLHQPPYPTGTHLGDPVCVLVEQLVNPIVEKHGVQLVLSGHEHGYERSFPLVGGVPVNASQPSTTYVITAGGGAGLEQSAELAQTALAVQAWNYLRVDVSATALTFQAIGIGGAVIDRVTLNPPPVVGAVVNAGDFSPAIAPGSLVGIFGQNLAIRPVSFSVFPLPHELGGISVTVNGIAAPLLYASPAQVNIQIPYGVSGLVTLTISTPNGSASIGVMIVPTAPSILAVVSGSDLNSSGNPVAPGDYVTLYTTGLGAPAGFCATGQAPSSAMSVAASVQVLLNGYAIQPSYAGLAPGYAGVGQVNFRVPGGLAASVSTLSVMADAAISSPVSLNIAAPGKTVAADRAAAASGAFRAAASSPAAALPR